MSDRRLKPSTASRLIGKPGSKYWRNTSHCRTRRSWKGPMMTPAPKTNFPKNNIQAWRGSKKFSNRSRRRTQKRKLRSLRTLSICGLSRSWTTAVLSRSCTRVRNARMPTRYAAASRGDIEKASSIFGARVIAKHFGLDPDRDLKFVAVGAVEGRFIRLTQGQIDAAILAPPLDSEAKKKGFNILARAEDILIFPETGLVTGVKKIQEKPDEIKRVIRAGIKANRYIRSNRDGTLQFIMEWLKVNREVATATYDGVVKVYNEDPSVCEKGLRVMIDERKMTLKITRDVPLSEVADLSLIREAQRELGVK